MDTVSVTNLVPVYSTRERGNEAYKELASFLDKKLVLDLDGPLVIAPSFIDSIILRLKEFNQTELVHFKTTDDNTLHSLKRICNLRDLRLTEESGIFSLA